jgi:branched-chain amino acid transport system ATP-binding protein
LLLSDSVHAAYGRKEILKGITLSVDSGAFVAIIGPNGAGKSTFLRVLAGYLRPTSGQVWLGGHDVTLVPPHLRVRLGVGFVIQGGKVFPSLTVKENLELAGTGLDKRLRGEETASVLELFPNLRAMLQRRAGLLSGGERQALAVGMILVRKPRLLLLDEPTAGLAPKSAQDMLERVRDVNRKWGISILMVEQNVSEALRVVQSAIVLANGTVVMDTDHPEEWLAGTILDEVFLGLGQRLRTGAERTSQNPREATRTIQ